MVSGEIPERGYHLRPFMKHLVHIPPSPPNHHNQGANMSNPYEIPAEHQARVSQKPPMSTAKKVGIGVAIFFGVVLLANACGDDTEPEAASGLDVLIDQTPAPTFATPTTVEPFVGIKPGTYLVGSQIEPGTYQSQGGSNCYWERLSSTSGDFDAIIANDWSTDNTQQLVTIDATDVAFKSSGCGNWTKI